MCSSENVWNYKSHFHWKVRNTKLNAIKYYVVLEKSILGWGTDVLSLEGNELVLLVCWYENWIIVQGWGRSSIMIGEKIVPILCMWTRTEFPFFLLKNSTAHVE